MVEGEEGMIDRSWGNMDEEMMTTKVCVCFFFFNDTATTEIYTLSLHDALPIFKGMFLAQASFWRSCHFVPRFSFPSSRASSTFVFFMVTTLPVPWLYFLRGRSSLDSRNGPFSHGWKVKDCVSPTQIRSDTAFGKYCILHIRLHASKKFVHHYCVEAIPTGASMTGALVVVELNVVIWLDAM